MQFLIIVYRSLKKMLCSSKVLVYSVIYLYNSGPLFSQWLEKYGQYPKLNTIPVSYTHLDVYKRQVVGSYIFHEIFGI